MFFFHLFFSFFHFLLLFVRFNFTCNICHIVNLHSTQLNFHKNNEKKKKIKNRNSKDIQKKFTFSTFFKCKWNSSKEINKPLTIIRDIRYEYKKKKKNEGNLFTRIYSQNVTVCGLHSLCCAVRVCF